MRPTVPGLAGRVHPRSRRWDLDDRQPARRRLARGVPRVREERRAAPPVDPPSAQRPHRRHAPAGRRRARWWRTTTSPSAASSRPSRPAASGRNRRSSSSRTTRRTAPTMSTPTVPCCSSSAPTRGGGRLDALHDLGRAAHHRAGPRAAADEPVRRGGDAAVAPSRVRPAAVPGAPGARASDETNGEDAPGARESEAMNFEHGPRPRARAQRDRLEGDARRRLRDAPPVRAAFVRPIADGED